MTDIIILHLLSLRYLFIFYLYKTELFEKEHLSLLYIGNNFIRKVICIWFKKFPGLFTYLCYYLDVECYAICMIGYFD